MAWFLVQGIPLNPSGDAHPEHPIVLPPENPGEPPRPAHPIYLPPYPEHPIVLPPDEGNGGGNGDEHPDHTLPGDLPHPDNSLPGDQPRPDHTLPGDLPHPDNSLPGRPPGTWGGSGEPFPTPPIVIVPPTNELPEIPDGKSLVVIINGDGEMQWVLIPTPGPGYNPPVGGQVPTPQ